MSDPIPPDDADRSWFRSQVDPIVGAEPVSDAWAAIEARTRGEAPAPAAPFRAARGRWLAAAIVLVLLATAAVVVAASQGGESDDVRSGPGASAGWYIPVGLPDGWVLQSAHLVPGGICDVSNRRWKTLPEEAVDGERPAIELTYAACGSLDPQPGDVAGPGLGLEGDPPVVVRATDDPANTSLLWESDGLWTLAGEGATEAQLVAAARAIVVDPQSEEPPLPQLAETGGGYGQDTDGGAVTSMVEITVQTPEGETLSYQLLGPGAGPAVNPFLHVEDHPLAHQPQPVELREPEHLRSNRTLLSMPVGYLFGGWDGADLVADQSVMPSPEGRRGDDEEAREFAARARKLVDQLVGSLRPVSADAWRAYLATAAGPTDQALRTADVLTDITEEPAPPATTTIAADDDATTAGGGGSTTTGPTTTSEATTTTTASVPDGPVTSEPGTVTPSAETRQRLRPLDGLEARLELPTSTVSLVPGTAGTLILHNTSDRAIVLNECAQLQTRWGLVPASSPADEVPSRSYIDCYDTEVVRIDPGATVRHRMDWRSPAPFTAQATDLRGDPRGTLAGGDYLAVVEIPGRNETIRISLPVTVPDPPCTTSAADVDRYVGTTIAEAERIAVSRSEVTRIALVAAGIAVVPDDLRCDRINLSVQNDVPGTVTNALRY